MEAENKLEEDTQYYMEIKNNYCELNTRILALLKILLLIIPEVQSIIYLYTFKISFKELTYSAPY